MLVFVNLHLTVVNYGGDGLTKHSAYEWSPTINTSDRVRQVR